MVRYLVERGGHSPHSLEGALVAAARYGHLPVVEYLARVGVDISDETLWFAASFGHFPIVRWLVERGFGIDDLGADGLERLVAADQAPIAEYIEQHSG